MIRVHHCSCRTDHAPIASAIECHITMFTSWPVVQALIETGHTLPMTANKYLLSCGLELIPLSLVRCLLQHGLCFSDGILQAVVCDGRIDILQLACARGHASQITSDMISVKSVQIAACRAAQLSYTTTQESSGRYQRPKEKALIEESFCLSHLLCKCYACTFPNDISNFIVRS